MRLGRPLRARERLFSRGAGSGSMQRASIVRQASLTGRPADCAPLAEPPLSTAPDRGRDSQAIAAWPRFRPPGQSLRTCSWKARLPPLRFLLLSVVAACGLASFSRLAAADDFVVISNR